MHTDVEVARRAKLKPITKIASTVGLKASEIDLYGKYKAKVNQAAFDRLSSHKDGKIILVTCIHPTPAGEGKTTISIGLGQALSKLGKKAVVALREPSLGPVFGIKGGATGGGYSQVAPMEEINLHFTGDIHAVSAANSLLCAAIDNHLYWGNGLGIDPSRILFSRALDMCERALREVRVGVGDKNGVERTDRFSITAASEVMATLCLSADIHDFRQRCGSILVAYTYDGQPVFARDLGVQGAMTVLMKEAIHPNLVQTLENTPCLIHGGPFANTAFGCSSVRSTRLAQKLGDYVVTEAGFGADLGAEKFFGIVCRESGMRPSVAVVVATVKALKYNGGAKKENLEAEDLMALAIGTENLERHVRNTKKYNVPVIVAINKHAHDTEKELSFMEGFCESIGTVAHTVECYSKGGAGALELAQEVVTVADEDESKGLFRQVYPLNVSIERKLEIIAKEIYGAQTIHLTEQAHRSIAEIEKLGFGETPVCVAKTQYSFSDDPAKLGAPKDFSITVRDVRLSGGGGFVVAYAGDIMTMPGLPKHPSFLDIDIDNDGKTVGNL